MDVTQPIHNIGRNFTQVDVPTWVECNAEKRWQQLSNVASLDHFSRFYFGIIGYTRAAEFFRELLTQSRVVELSITATQFPPIGPEIDATYGSQKCVN